MLLDTMFEVPGSGITSVIITEDCILHGAPPKYISDTKEDTMDKADTSKAESAEVFM